MTKEQAYKQTIGDLNEALFLLDRAQATMKEHQIDVPVTGILRFLREEILAMKRKAANTHG